MAQAYELICVTGLTPQIVTETIYALGADKEYPSPSGLPDAIHVLTTIRGKALIESSLLGTHGQFMRLRRDYGWISNRIEFDADHVHVICDPSGQPLEDIRYASDNAAAADFIAAFVREAVNRSARLHVSLAGGRKTMGYFAGYALSLYGRPVDRLSHILVNPPFESHPEFFYPPPKPVWLETADGYRATTADARISLADIPFVRLRNGLEQDLLEGGLSFSESVALTQQLVDPPSLHIDLDQRRAWLQGHPVRLSDTLFLWLVWFADRGRRRLGPLAFDETGATDLLRVITWIEGAGASRLRESAENAQTEAARGEKDYFERTCARFNKALYERSGLCRAAAKRYTIRPFGHRPHTRYGVSLPPEAISIAGDP